MSEDKSYLFMVNTRSQSSSSCESSSDDQLYHSKTNPLKHKTELCKTYSELGYCNYGQKCKFAHSKEELKSLPVSSAFRKKKCKGYWSNGCCLYGQRCQFGHSGTNWEDSACLIGLSAWNNQDDYCAESSKLLKILQ